MLASGGRTGPNHIETGALVAAQRHAALDVDGSCGQGCQKGSTPCCAPDDDRRLWRGRRRRRQRRRVVQNIQANGKITKPPEA